MEDDAIFKPFLSCLLVLGISLASAAAPIATEFCVDLCRPVSEENIGNPVNKVFVLPAGTFFISGSWLTLWFNLVALAFFLAFQIPGVRNSPLNNIPAADFEPRKSQGWSSMAQLHTSLQHADSPSTHPGGEAANQRRELMLGESQIETGTRST